MVIKVECLSAERQISNSSPAKQSLDAKEFIHSSTHSFINSFIHPLIHSFFAFSYFGLFSFRHYIYTIWKDPLAPKVQIRCSQGCGKGRGWQALSAAQPASYIFNMAPRVISKNFSKGALDVIFGSGCGLFVATSIFSKIEA